MSQNPHKAIKAIEILSGGSLLDDLEFMVIDDGKRLNKMTKKELKEYIKMSAEVIGKIYMIAHSEGRCRHASWEEIKYEIIKEEKK